MKDIWDIIKQNQKSAIQELKIVANHGIEFNSDDENCNENDERPYVLVANGDGEIFDLPVDKVRLTYNDVIELYIEDWDEWVLISECLSASENNVYMSIDQKIMG